MYKSTTSRIGPRDLQCRIPHLMGDGYASDITQCLTVFPKKQSNNFHDCSHQMHPHPRISTFFSSHKLWATERWLFVKISWAKQCACMVKMHFAWFWNCISFKMEMETITFIISHTSYISRYVFFLHLPTIQ